ncbi:NADPH:quinone reductase-like Zn-dependent oxidoreductase [Wenyingzhuangia heitensis]|uniref:NADPH:quinone reductase-like Zn-dependent oxidoreductase n=1 Tax=Wenyingzhuangia heitensis TaxID=1487859 RepID=A0ABX0UE68_9FLAO|nr:NADP-dependent oxidoreductase [Wenyingzhuangia heitensis]NIJ45481.1 NADPH:quinone reductase-like Zn-dependent oxidoreductase [Wenyingzhuangia heitensis]
MKAITIAQAGGVENLILTTVEKPILKENEVLVKTKAISINPVDYKIRSVEPGLNMMYGEQRPVILGWDISGTVSQIGNKVTKFKVGDTVFGMVNFPGNGAAYAEYVASPEDHLAKMPKNISFEDAAAATLAALTALQVLETRIKKDDRILIHAGSGGVGHFSIQIAKAMGAYVITTSSAKNKDLVMGFGADEHIDYIKQKFEEVVSDLDFVFDMFNGDILLKSIDVVKSGGTIMSLPAPDFSDEITTLAKERNVNITNLLVQSSAKDMHTISKMLEEGTLTSHVSETFSFEDLNKAHQHLESGRTVGKVIVKL